MIVKISQLLFPKEDLKSAESKYDFNVILFFKMNIFSNKYNKSEIWNFTNKIIDLLNKVLV